MRGVWVDLLRPWNGLAQMETIIHTTTQKASCTWMQTIRQGLTAMAAAKCNERWSCHLIAVQLEIVSPWRQLKLQLFIFDDCLTTICLLDRLMNDFSYWVKLGPFYHVFRAIRAPSYVTTCDGIWPSFWKLIFNYLKFSAQASPHNHIDIP